MLDRQLESLSLANNLDHVLVVSTQHDVMDDPYAEKLKEFPEVVFRENMAGSYGSWKYAWDLYGNKFDWYFFLEDDYVFAIDNFDQRMIDMFDNDMGYLCSWYIKNHLFHPTINYHASISNGLVHRRALEKADFSAMMNLDIYDNRCQSNWSWALDATGYKTKDVHGSYDTPFFSGKTVWSFNDHPVLIKPVQMFDPDVQVIKYDV